MTGLIIGYPDSGKSKLAEDMVMEISAPGERIYLATMIPYGEEGSERIKKHREMREGKGFVTIEAPFDVTDALAQAPVPENATVLLECMSNLVANELFERHSDSEILAGRMMEDMRRLAEQCGNLIIVSNHFEITEDFDEETVLYAQVLDEVNDRLCRIADKVITL